MSDETPLSTWKQCKQISEALAPPPDPDEAGAKVREALLAQLAATGERGAALAARFAATYGPIEAEPADMEAFEAMGKRIADHLESMSKQIERNFSMPIEWLPPVPKSQGEWVGNICGNNYA
jgi:hypothetical protein